MAITGLDAAIAGMKMPVPITKAGITMAAVGALRGYTPWYAAGNPGASVAPTIGVNGEAVTPALATPANVVGGRLIRQNPPGGQDAYVGRLGVTASQTGVLWLIDRLWHNSGLSATSTTAQAITPAALPPRDRNATADGDGVMAALEWSATGGAGTPTVTLTYTAEDGATGKTATLTGVASPPVGTVEIFNLAAGDYGVRAPTSFIQSVTRTSGAFSLMLFRVVAQLEVPALSGAAIDILTGGRAEVLDDSVLQLLWFPSATTALNLAGSYIETQG